MVNLKYNSTMIQLRVCFIHLLKNSPVEIWFITICLWNGLEFHLTSNSSSSFLASHSYYSFHLKLRGNGDFQNRMSTSSKNPFPVSIPFNTLSLVRNGADCAFCLPQILTNTSIEFSLEHDWMIIVCPSIVQFVSCTVAWVFTRRWAPLVPRLAWPKGTHLFWSIDKGATCRIVWYTTNVFSSNANRCYFAM